VLADAGTQEGIVTATLDLALVGKTRASLPSLQHDRQFNAC
jgi:predicted amidohydrolase